MFRRLLVLLSLLVGVLAPSTLFAFPIDRMTRSTVYIAIDGDVGHCSGVIVSSYQVVTARHCIEGHESWSIRFSDGQVRAASPIWSTPMRDVAVLGVSVPATMTHARLACRSPVLGERVAAVGFPLDFGLTVTQGAVIILPDPTASNRWAVVVDANVNPGNSGGPLFDARGLMLAIVYGYNRETRWGAAVPAADFCGNL